jgi:putative heme-binding domain-containing protein
MTFDAWGNRFVCDNRHPCRHVIFEEDFIKRCPHVAFPAVVHDVIPADDKNQVFPLTSAWTTSNLHAGTFTASCGVTVYTGDWLPEEFRGNVFVCEPTGNLVQRAILEPDGVTFKSRNPYQRSPVAPRQEQPNAPTTSANKSTPNGQSESTARSADLSRSDRATETQEFLASRDDWFRPVDLQNGPDGALYVVDMYRAVIEHPEWVPDELKKRPDTWLGNDKGRIYRIRPSSPVAPRQEQPSARSTSEKQSTSTARSAALSRSDRATLGKPIVSVANLNASFNSANGWHRTTASRVAIEGGSQQSASTEVLPITNEAKILALRAIGLRLSESTAINGLVSNDDRLRAEAVVATSLSWQQLVGDGNFDGWRRPQNVLKTLLQDKSALVRFRVIQALRFDDDHDLATVLAACGCRDADDRWTQLAVIGSLHTNPISVLEMVFDRSPCVSLLGNDGDPREKQFPDWVDARGRFIAMLCEQVIARTWSVSTPDELRESLETLSRIVETIASYADGSGYGSALADHGLRGTNVALARKGRSFESERRSLSLAARNALDRIVDGAARRLANKQDEPDLYFDSLALRLLRFGRFDKVNGSITSIAETGTDQAMRLAAIETFASFAQPEVDAWLIERYRSETPAIRRAILAALFASKERQLRLLEAIEQKQIAATELDPVRVNQLTQAKDETIRERAKKILAAAAPASRKEVLDAYQSALSLKGDPQRGKAVFVKNCSTCHRVDNVGVNVAPDISDTRTKKPEQLLLDILDPNKAIDANYFAYVVVTKEGKTESGVISSESSNSITLKQPEGKVLTLLRSDIEELRNTGLSLMPVGVEKNIDQQAMTDLIFWLKNWRYLDGKVPATSIEPK